MQVAISRARFNDLEDLIPLIIAHAEYERAIISTESLQENLAQAMRGEHPRLFIFYARLAKELVGYASLAREFSTWQGRDLGHMDCLYVTENVRNRNIGIKLFREVERQALNLGISALEWQTPQWNDKASSFYKSLGATSQRKLRYRYLMKRTKSE